MPSLLFSLLFYFIFLYSMHHHLTHHMFILLTVSVHQITNSITAEFFLKILYQLLKSLCHNLNISTVSKSGYVFTAFSFLFGFLGPQVQHMEVPRLRVKLELQLEPTPQPQQCGIWAKSVTWSTAYSNARPLTHWGRPGIKPRSSLMDPSQVGYPWATMGAP